MKKILFIFLLGCASVCMSQAIDPKLLDVPQVAPSSPNVASIEKFGNIPVTMYNGTTSVNVPVWNIKCGNISWPVSFAYNTAGIKVDEVASNVGTGWSGLFTGVISRSVNGRPDEEETNPAFEPDFATVNYTDDWYYMWYASTGESDAELDLFTYNFNGRSGKFYITQSGTFFPIPYANLKFAKTSSGFTIIDEEGSIYTFDKQEIVNEASSSPVISSWYITKAQTADKKQSIDFFYNNPGSVTQSTETFTQGVGSRVGVCDRTPAYNPTPDKTIRSTHTLICELNRIDFPGGSLNFTYVSDRTDMVGTTNNRLSKVEVKQANTNQILRTFNLFHSYFTPGNRLKLNSIDETQRINSPKKTYAFSYNSTAMVPVGSYAQDKWGFNNGKTGNVSLMQTEVVNFETVNYNLGNSNRAVDTVACKAGSLTSVSWPTGGRTEFTYDVHQHTNGALEFTTIQQLANATALSHTATATFTYPGYVGPARAVVEISRWDYAGATGMPYVQIKDLVTSEIIFVMYNHDPGRPLNTEQTLTLVGGRNYEIKAFLFSSNTDPNFLTSLKVLWDEYTTAPIIEKGGGLRIRTIKNFTKTGELAGTEYYEYEPGVTLTPHHFVNRRYKTVNFAHLGGENCACQIAGPPARVYMSNSAYPLTAAGGVPVMYRKVTKYQLDGAGNNKGKSEYEFNVIQDHPANIVGATVFVYFSNNEWKNGLLLKESHYKRNASQYTLLKTVENQYTELKQSSIQDLQIKNITIVTGGCLSLDVEFVSGSSIFYYIPRYTGISKLMKTIETVYDDNSNILQSTVINNYAGNTHDFVTKTEKADSKAETYYVEQKYPIDFTSPGNVYEKMLNANIVSPVIESKQYKLPSSGGAAILQYTLKTNYKDWKSNGLVLTPEIVQASLNTDPLKDKVVYTNYNDWSQATEVKKDKNTPKAYLYGYNYQYPVAEVTNTVQSNIAYTSFEHSDMGSWLYSGNAVKDPTAPTGSMCFTFTNTIVKMGHNTALSYIVSYWKKAGTVTIAGTTATTGRTVNGWTYYEHKINSTAPSTIIVNGSGATIDELRLYPINAMMATFTFDPLIGMTSQCDINNRISYYEYDELQRVALIRDQDRNIVKKFAYNYNNTPAYENIYYSVVKSGIFQKTGCSGCNLGNAVTYTVPAGSYSSTYSQAEADNSAQADVTNNGLAYANANGVCGTPTDATILSTISVNKQVQYTFYNTCTGVSYVRNRTGNEVNWALSGIPMGTYNITFAVATAGTYTFTANGIVRSGYSTPTTISNVAFGIYTNNVSVTP